MWLDALLCTAAPALALALRPWRQLAQGALLCLFAASLLARALAPAPAGPTPDLAGVALWLMAWGDAVLAGMLVAVFVAFRPEWLATWSDRHYLSSP